MSFDLKIFQGDLQIGQDSDLEQIRDTNKLIQDILKIVMTPKGGNPFFPAYGSTLSKNLIGNIFTFEFSTSIATDQLNSALETLKNLQLTQAKSGQRLTAAELLAAIQSVNITRNQTDPRYFRIDITILTRALTQATTSLNIRNSL